MRNTMTANELLELVLHRKMAFLPNTFDDVPIVEAREVLKQYDQASLVLIEAKARDLNWSQARKDAEIRCVADEVYWTAQGV